MNTAQLMLSEVWTFAMPALFNLYFALAAIPAGFLLAILVALAKSSRLPLLSIPARAYIYFFRGTPFFIQLFAFYSGALALNTGTWKPLGIDWLVLSPLFLGPAILALNTTAYTAEIFHGAIRALPSGEIEAARAFGLPPGRRFRRVVWPHLIRLAWPAYTNEVVFLFQATALIYLTLPVVGDQRDLMSTAGNLYARDFNASLHYGVAALYFLAISGVIFYVFSRIYRRLTRHLPPPPPLTFGFRRVLGR